MMKNYDLFIVGNGFDIGCGLKTKYSDFLSFYTSNGIKNSLLVSFNQAYHYNYYENDEWNSFEKLICQYLQFLNYIFTDSNNVKSYFSNPQDDAYGYNIYQYFYMTINDISKLPYEIILLLRLPNCLEHKIRFYSDADYKNALSYIESNDLKTIYLRCFVNTNDVNRNKKWVLNYLLKEFEAMLIDIESKLRDYVKQQSNSQTDLPKLLRNISVQKLISFNYTHTATKLFNVPENNVVYVHGDINSNVILGIEPSMISNQTFDEETDFIKFFKRFRRVFFDCNRNYEYKIMNNLSNKSVIGIYGHSLDLADRSILKPLFELECSSYDIYCYKNIGEYKLKLAKLIGLDLFDRLNKSNKINYILINE